MWLSDKSLGLSKEGKRGKKGVEVASDCNCFQYGLLCFPYEIGLSIIAMTPTFYYFMISYVIYSMPFLRFYP